MEDRQKQNQDSRYCASIAARAVKTEDEKNCAIGRWTAASMH